MTKKASKKIAANKPLAAKLQSLVSTVASCGFNTANAYADCVDAVRQIITNTRAGAARDNVLSEAANAYKAGYVARSLLASPAYAKNWGNMTQALQIEQGATILKRAAPTSTKPDRRTEQEHKACRASDVSWYKVRTAAGLVADKSKAPNKRKPRPSTNEPKAPIVDVVKASPKLESKAAANDYFGTAAAALLATANKNAKLIDPRISSAVSDFLAAIKAVLA